MHLPAPVPSPPIANSRCLIPDFDGAVFSLEWKEALWGRFFTEAPRRLRQSVEHYRIVKTAWGRFRHARASITRPWQLGTSGLRFPRFQCLAHALERFGMGISAQLYCKPWGTSAVIMPQIDPNLLHQRLPRIDQFNRTQTHEVILFRTASAALDDQNRNCKISEGAIPNSAVRGEKLPHCRSKSLTSGHSGRTT